jgi:sugar phosphate isomerase/epimerase
MRISVMAYSFASLLERGQIDTAGVVALLRSIGVEAIEMSDRYVDGVERIDADIAAYDLYCDLVTAVPSSQKAELARAREGLARARRLGAQHVMVVPGSLERSSDADAARRRVIEGLRELLDDAARLGLQLSVENLGYQAALCGRAAHLTEICDGVGAAVGLTFDAGNFLFADEDPVVALRAVGDRVVHVHLKDWTPERVGAPLGAGIVDLAAVVATLRSLGYDGYLSVEYEGPADPRDAVRQGVDYLRRLLEG